MKLIIVAVVASAAASATLKIDNTVTERPENKSIPALPVVPFDTTCAEKIIVYEPLLVCTGNTSLQHRPGARSAVTSCAASQPTWLKI
jgi:hypothetical protein